MEMILEIPELNCGFGFDTAEFLLKLHTMQAFEKLGLERMTELMNAWDCDFSHDDGRVDC